MTLTIELDAFGVRSVTCATDDTAAEVHAVGYHWAVHCVDHLLGLRPSVAFAQQYARAIDLNIADIV